MNAQELITLLNQKTRIYDDKIDELQRYMEGQKKVIEVLKAFRDDALKNGYAPNLKNLEDNKGEI